MHRNRRLAFILPVAIILLAGFIIAGRRTPTATDLPEKSAVGPNTLTPAQKSDAAKGEEIIANRKNLAPGSDQVTMATIPQQTILNLRFDNEKLQAPTDLHAAVGENLKILISSMNQKEEVDVVIKDFAQRTTVSQNSDTAFEFTPGIAGTFPIEVYPEDGEPVIQGRLIVE